MKKFICTLLFLATSWVTGWAADKLPSLCDEWNMLMVYYPEGFDHYRTKKIRLTTDTIINDTSYVKLQQGDGYIGALREDNDANIFYIPAQSTHEYLLYAFHAHVGDVLSNLWIGGNPAYHPNIDKITVTDISNTTPRVFTITLDYTYGNDYQGKEIIEWLEGIGLMEGPAGSDCIPIDECGGDAYQTLLCAYKNGEQIYVSDAGEKYGCEYSANATTQQLLGEWQVYRERVTGTMWDNEGMPYTGSYTHDVNMRMLYVFTPDFEYELQMDEASGVVHYSDTRSYTIEPLTADTWLLTINGAFDMPKPSDPAISGRSPITIYKITENEMEWEYTYYSGDEGSMTYYQYVRRYQSNEQGVENVLSTSSARKILRNNQILILRGEKTYTLTGQQLK